MEDSETGCSTSILPFLSLPFFFTVIPKDDVGVAVSNSGSVPLGSIAMVPSVSPLDL